MILSLFAQCTPLSDLITFCKTSWCCYERQQDAVTWSCKLPGNSKHNLLREPQQQPLLPLAFILPPYLHF